MATAANIIDRAMRLLGQIGSGETSTVAEYADGLTAINAMLGSWNNERLMCYAIRDESIPLAATNATRTIGPNGNLVSARPVRIVDAYIVVSGISSPVRMVNEEEYAAISVKASTSDWPIVAWYQPSVPDGTLYLYPVPSASSTLHVLTQTPLTAFATTGDTVTLPPGWEEALASNLAITLAPEFETEPHASVIKMAQDSKANIKRINSRPLRAYTELPYLVGRYRGNILTGTP